MKPIRVLMILSAILASSTYVPAQSPSAPSLQAIRAAAEYPAISLELWFRSGTPMNLFGRLDGPPPAVVGLTHPELLLDASAEFGMEIGLQNPTSAGGRAGPVTTNPPAVQPTCQQCWYSQAILHTVAAFQRMRAICASSQTVAQPACPQCPAALSPAAGCAVGSAGCCTDRCVVVGSGCCGTAAHQALSAEAFLQQMLAQNQQQALRMGYRIYAVPVEMLPTSARACCGGDGTVGGKNILLRVPTSQTGSRVLGVGINSNAGAVGSFAQRMASPCAEIKEFIQYTVQPAPTRVIATPTPCCCAKACACCESCATKAAQPAVELRNLGQLRERIGEDIMINVQGPVDLKNLGVVPARGGMSFPPQPWSELIVEQTCQAVQVFPQPVSPAQGFTPQVAYVPQVTYVPVAQPQTGTASASVQGCPVLQLPAQSTGPLPPYAQHVTYMHVTPARPARFVTPELEAHCERMTHRGDQIILEGHVLLLCKKHAQPIRIEAERVVVNMKDGSFQVESTPQTVTTTSFGVSQTPKAVAPRSSVSPTAPTEVYRHEAPKATQRIIQFAPDLPTPVPYGILPK
jgi:hypothetical protein